MLGETLVRAGQDSRPHRAREGTACCGLDGCDTGRSGRPAAAKGRPARTPRERVGRHAARLGGPRLGKDHFHEQRCAQGQSPGRSEGKGRV